MITISINATCEMKESFFIQKDGRDSVSILWSISCPLIPSEGENTGPTVEARNVGVDFQVKTDPEQRPPAANGSNVNIFLDISRETLDMNSNQYGIFVHSTNVLSVVVL